ncbi:MAG: N-acetylmuramoyl-L-alanine amidase [Deltaproteobacteria bacterium]|nr:N-acetylmuramoyl-L-alanine amidase [Deltaproteobacteria bacterium]
MLYRLLAVLMVTLVTSCSLPSPFEEDAPSSELPSYADQFAELDGRTSMEIIEAASDRFGVPRDLLVAMAWKQTSFFVPEVEEFAEEEGHGPPVFGLLGLELAQLPDAAETAGYRLDEVQGYHSAATFAAAARLAEHAGDADPVVVESAWWSATAAFLDHDELWLSHAFAFDVFASLQRGLSVHDEQGESVAIAPRVIEGLDSVAYVRPPGVRGETFSSNTDYPGADAWTPAHSSNQSSRGGPPQRVVIHTTEGSYSSAINWFRNSVSNVSSHYVLRRSDGHVTQMVRDNRKAWHACQNNSDTIGLEHEGQSFNSSQWTPQILESSAQLTAWLVSEYNIPLDRQHIVGHGEIQPSSCAGRSDPGPYFPWDWYMGRVEEILSGPVAVGGPVAFSVPRDGDVVGDPVVMRVTAQETHHTELWSGPQLLAGGLLGSPLHAAHGVGTAGLRTLSAKGFDPSGVLVSESDVAVEVRQLAALNLSAAPLSGATWRLSANVTGNPAFVRYVLDGSTLVTVSSGIGFAMDVDLPQAGGTHLIQARAFDGSGDLIAEGSEVLEITPVATGQGSILDWWVTPQGGSTLRFSASATSEVESIEYWANEYKLVNPSTGAGEGTAPFFTFDFPFLYPGPRAIQLRAFNASGDLVDVASGTAVVPSSDLLVSWSALPDGAYRFTATAPAGTESVTYAVDGFDLEDRTTGALEGVPGDFALDYLFANSGVRSLTAEALDANGATLDTYATLMPVIGSDAGGGDPPPPSTVSVSALPYSASGNTALSSVSNLQGYSCAPSINEGGPEVTYVVEVPSDGILTATIQDGSGVDVDVHILSAPDPGACLARGHVTAEAAVPAGQVFVVVDSWVSAGGNVQSGAYSVSISHQPSAGGGGTSCPAGQVCLDSLPFNHSSTTVGGQDNFDSYSCSPGSNESGPERVYAIDLPGDGLLTATVMDGVGVDVDVHILGSLDPSDCLARGHHTASADVSGSTVYVVVDTWVTGSGTALSGAYSLDLQLLPSSTGSTGGGSSCPSGQICVEQLPFGDGNNTTGGSSLFDSYSCAPGTDESGPERVYRVTVPSSGTLSASINHAAGIDVDVHVLSALSPNACVVRGHWSASTAVTPGVWYVVIDSWVNASGTAFSGAYTLDISL